MLNGPYPLRDLTTLGPTPRGHRRHVICPPDDVALWSDSAELLGIAVQVSPHPAVPVDEAFTWTAPPAPTRRSTCGH